MQHSAHYLPLLHFVLHFADVVRRFPELGS